MIKFEVKNSNYSKYKNPQVLLMKCFLLGKYPFHGNPFHTNLLFLNCTVQFAQDWSFYKYFSVQNFQNFFSYFNSYDYPKRISRNSSIFKRKCMIIRQSTTKTNIESHNIDNEKRHKRVWTEKRRFWMNLKMMTSRKYNMINNLHAKTNNWL